MLKYNESPGSSGANKNTKLGHFQQDQLSVKAAGKVMGGFGGSDEECMNLESQYEEAVMRGDMATARRIMREMMQACFTDGL